MRRKRGGRRKTDCSNFGNSIWLACQVAISHVGRRCPRVVAAAAVAVLLLHVAGVHVAAVAVALAAAAVAGPVSLAFFHQSNPIQSNRKTPLQPSPSASASPVSFWIVAILPFCWPDKIRHFEGKESCCRSLIQHTKKQQKKKQQKIIISSITNRQFCPRLWH